jgi:hypothetical protein
MRSRSMASGPARKQVIVPLCILFLVGCSQDVTQPATSAVQVRPQHQEAYIPTCPTSMTPEACLQAYNIMQNMTLSPQARCATMAYDALRRFDDGLMEGYDGVGHTEGDNGYDAVVQIPANGGSDMTVATTIFHEEAHNYGVPGTTRLEDQQAEEIGASCANSIGIYPN